MARIPLPLARAFTLIELLVVIAVIGILLAIAFPALHQRFLERGESDKRYEQPSPDRHRDTDLSE